MNALLTWIFHRLGWRLDGVIPDYPKFLMAVAPHTSGWDFVIGMLARSALKLNHVKFLGKKELFDGPFGWFFRRVGGTPVDRTASTDLVAQSVQHFSNNERFVLAMAPEGTRKKVEKLKTGFYYIALGAGVPIVPVGFDFPTKRIVAGKPFMPTGNIEADMPVLMDFFKGIRGKRPELGPGDAPNQPRN